MDKQKISIDDLFRQRLSDREEAMPPGAWGQMKDLLDQQPSRVLAGRNRGRGGILLLLAGLLTIGGGYAYNTYSSQSGESSARQASITSQRHSVASKSIGMASGTSTSKTTASGKQTTGIALGTTGKTKTSGNPAEGASAPVRTNGSEEVSARAIVGSGTSVPTGTAASVQPGAETHFKTTLTEIPVAGTLKPVESKTDFQPAVAKNHSTLAIPEPAGTIPVASREQLQIAPLSWIQSSVNILLRGPAVVAANADRVTAYLHQLAQPAGAASGMTATTSGPAAPARVWSAKTPQGLPGAVAITASDHPSVPLSISNPTVTNSGTAPVGSVVPAVPEPQATPQETALQSSRLVTGVLAGINSTLSGGSGALQGIQLGVYSLLNLNEKWSLGADLQYRFRLNNSMDLKDDYYTGKVTNEGAISRNGQTYYPVRYDVDSMLSRYSFVSYNSLVLPLYLHYQANRVAAYGGVNLGFHFRPNVTRTDIPIATISRYDTVLAGTPIVAPASRASDVALSDFDSRFSVGYVAGVQYRITPKLHLDLRVSQQLWDNLYRRSAGSAIVSETYLYLPVVQLSAGYRFQKSTPKKPTHP